MAQPKRQREFQEQPPKSSFGSGGDETRLGTLQNLINRNLKVVKSGDPSAAPSQAPTTDLKKIVEAKKKASWRQKFSLKAYLTLVVFIAIVTASLLAGGYAFQLQYRKALEDTWAILFLDGERQARSLRERIERVPTAAVLGPTSSSALRHPDAIFFLENNSYAETVYSIRPISSFAAESIGEKSLAFSAPWSVIKREGISYVVKNLTLQEVRSWQKSIARPGSYLGAWAVNLKRAFVQPRKNSLEKTIYVVTRAGKLLYTNDRDNVEEDTLATRPLVQKFVDSKLQSAQLEYTNYGVSYYGFFHEVPGTNALLFVETGKGDALNIVLDAGKRFLVVLIFIVAAAIFLVQLPIRNVIRPLSELVHLSKEVARGNFKVRPKHSGFGEVSQLTNAFTNMAQNLIVRDRSIQALMVEQRAKVKLEQEISIAKSLQDNLLPRTPLTVDSGLSMTSVYIPAAHVAGDWYTYHFAPETGETVIVMADVSGHDMAASLFTAVIAGVFYEMRDAYPKDFPMKTFAEHINRRIAQFGAGKWHATMQIVRFMKGEDSFAILNCGHTFPLVIAQPRGAGAEVRSRVVRMPSEPLGLAESIDGEVKTLGLQPGDTVLMYTDGIVETKSPAGKNYGTKRMLKLGQANSSKPTHEIVHTILRDCETYRGSNSADDDICLLAVRIGNQ